MTLSNVHFFFYINNTLKNVFPRPFIQSTDSWLKRKSSDVRRQRKIETSSDRRYAADVGEEKKKRKDASTRGHLRIEVDKADPSRRGFARGIRNRLKPRRSSAFR